MAILESPESRSPTPPASDWEAFYRCFRNPGYIRGYEVHGKLGSGRFGEVYRAKKASIDKSYAIKFLRVDDPALRAAVVRELERVPLFAQIDHPNLVSIEDRGEVDGIPYIIMGFAGEETLRTRLAEGRLAREDALRIFVQAARGVAELHDHALVHFDLKPANIFLRGEVARVGDYGLSRLVTASQDALSCGRGTPCYMAPELLERRGDHRSDIYAMGVILFECLVGEPPFSGENEWQILNRHKTELPRIPDELGEAERRVLARCLAKDPAARPQALREVVGALGARRAPERPTVVRDPPTVVRDPPGATLTPAGLDLAAEQRAAVRAEPGNLRIVAGPGSGKTRVLTERIRHFVESEWCEPCQVLAVTFTVKATEEMRGRLRASLGRRARGITIQTLHALALSIVRRDPEGAGLPPTFEIDMPAPRRERLLDRALDRLRASLPAELRDPRAAWAAICRLKQREPQRLVEPDDSPEARLCRAFDALVHATGTVLFEDLPLGALRLLRADPELRALLEGRHRAVFVDEFQDLNATQFQLVHALAAGHGRLSVVGDDDQCIYSWRGADPAFLRDFDARFPGARTIQLPKNYRSTERIVAAATAVIGHNRRRIAKPLAAATGERGARIRLRRFDGKRAEVAGIVRAVERLLERGVEPREVALLARNNDLVQALVLEARARNLPVHAENPLLSEAGRALLALLRSVLDGPAGRLPAAAVNLGARRLRGALGETPSDELEERLRAEAPRAGNDALQAFLAALDRARAAIHTEPALAVLGELARALDLPEVVTGHPQADTLQAATALALELATRQDAAAGSAGWAELVDELGELAQSNDSLAEGVSVLTVHRAKGLEFDEVFMLGLQEDIFPNAWFAPEDSPAREEERRLFYVGMTRAREALHLSRHRPAKAGALCEGDGFLAEIPAELVEESGGATAPNAGE